MSERGGKNDGAEEFFNSRVKELCSEYRILEKEVRVYIYFFMLRVQFSYVHSLNESFCIKIFLF